MKKIDLHIHTVSTVSDPTFDFSMNRLKQYVEEAELDAIAITNHNVFDEQQYNNIVTAVDIPVFPGIEIDIEEGHLLLITSSNDLQDFKVRCAEITKLNDTAGAYISESTFLRVFPRSTLDKYILIPHYDKSPKLALPRIPVIREFITSGEVSSIKKFILQKRDTMDLVPVYFSDARMKETTEAIPDRQTFFDVDEITINSLKHALSDHAKVSISKDDGNVVFQVLDNGLKISSGVTVVLGKRSSGKSHTLDEISEHFELPSYIRQFELLSRDEEKDKQRFDEILRSQGDSITQEFLAEFREVVDSIQNVDLRADEHRIDDYLTKLKKAASEAERQDAYAKTKIFSETVFDLKELSPIVKLIDSVDNLLENKEYQSVINQFFSRKQMIGLGIALRTIYISENEKNQKLKFVNDIISSTKSDLKTRTSNTAIPDIDFYKIQLNVAKIEKFRSIADLVRKRRILEQKSLYSFKIIALARPVKTATDLHNIITTSKKMTPLLAEYDDPYSYLCALRNTDFILSSDYYKLFACIDYAVYNRYGTKASGGERSEYNLLQRLEDATQTDILILDEPESSFDNIFLKDGVNERLKELSKRVPVIVATHNNTIGASLHPDYIIYTSKEVLEDGEIKYHLYCGHPSNEDLVDLEGNRIKRRDVMLDCLEAGEKAYMERRSSYEVPVH